ncbi:MAG: hypothetical protein ACRESP_11905, partial [Pseudomonas sp.]
MKVLEKLLFGLALIAPLNTFAACPVGQYEICLGSCICSPIDPGQAGTVLDDLGRMASSSLAMALQQAHDTAAAGTVLPIPLHIRA